MTHQTLSERRYGKGHAPQGAIASRIQPAEIQEAFRSAKVPCAVRDTSKKSDVSETGNCMVC